MYFRENVRLDQNIWSIAMLCGRTVKHTVATGKSLKRRKRKLGIVEPELK